MLNILLISRGGSSDSWEGYFQAGRAFQTVWEWSPLILFNRNDKGGAEPTARGRERPLEVIKIGGKLYEKRVIARLMDRPVLSVVTRDNKEQNRLGYLQVNPTALQDFYDSGFTVKRLPFRAMAPVAKVESSN